VFADKDLSVVCGNGYQIESQHLYMLTMLNTLLIPITIENNHFISKSYAKLFLLLTFCL